MNRTLALLGFVLLFAVVGPAAAQNRDSIPGVALGLQYDNRYVPVIALQPFTARFGGEAAADQVEAIVARDLRYSDRFKLIDSIPAALVSESVDYALWDRLGAVWLLTGQVEGAGSNFTLVLQAHDVVYKRLKETARFAIPNPDSPGFRMAVHRASDEVVRWIFGERGAAATRVAFSMVTAGTGAKEIWVVDSDGENLQRVTNHGQVALSPAWSPDGTRLAFSSLKTEQWRIYVREMASGRERMIEGLPNGDQITPAFAPDGQTLAVSVTTGERSGIYSYNLDRNCCLKLLTGGRWNDFSPVYSPDGNQLVFNSNRLGSARPQIYIMPAGGGDADLVSPYAFDRPGYFTSPDFSPNGEMVAFHGALSRGLYHILVARLSERGRRVNQLTFEGNNEDPSWAPDSRHLVFMGERRNGKGLYVVDVVTGNTRILVPNVAVNVPQWSPSMSGN